MKVTIYMLTLAIIAAALIGAQLAIIVMRRAAAAKARTAKRIRESAIAIFRKGALREARAALAEIGRCPHDREHVKRVAEKGIFDSAMPPHLAEDGER